jgi:hypothetical protein
MVGEGEPHSGRIRKGALEEKERGGITSSSS